MNSFLSDFCAMDMNSSKLRRWWRTEEPGTQSVGVAESEAWLSDQTTITEWSCERHSSKRFGHNITWCVELPHSWESLAPLSLKRQEQHRSRIHPKWLTQSIIEIQIQKAFKKRHRYLILWTCREFYWSTAPVHRFLVERWMNCLFLLHDHPWNHPQLHG